MHSVNNENCKMKINKTIIYNFIVHIVHSTIYVGYTGKYINFVNFDLPWSCRKLPQSKRYNNILMRNFISLLKQLALRKNHGMKEPR